MWHIFAPIAQLVEHRTLNPQVVGSIPTGGTNKKRAVGALLCLLIQQRIFYENENP